MNYLQITHEDVCNGNGLRVSLWVSGCSHHCFNCHNPETWDKDGGFQFDENIQKEIFECLSKEYIDGITLTGGDPLFIHNLDDILFLIQKIRNLFPNKTIWIYSGYTWNQIMHPIITDNFSPQRDELLNKRKQIVSLCDVLVDGEYIDEKRDLTLEWRGSSNQRVIDVKQSLAQNKIVLYCD